MAVTRARRQLVVVGDVETCSSDTFLRGLLDYMSEHGDHRSAAEFLDIHDPPAFMGLESLVVEMDPSPATQPEIVKPANKSQLPKAPKRRPTQVSSAYLTIPRSEYEAKLDDALTSLILRYAEEVLPGGVVCITPYDSTVHRGSELVMVKNSDSGFDWLEFPSTLNSFQRMKLHAIAEERSLVHRTIEGFAGKVLHISLKDAPSKACDEESSHISANPMGKAQEEIHKMKESPRVEGKLSTSKQVSASCERKSTGVSSHGSVYVSPYRLAQQQKTVDFTIEDEDALLDSAIDANKVISCIFHWLISDV